MPPMHYEVMVLLGGLKLVDTLGGGSSRGLGRCRVDLPETFTLELAGGEVRLVKKGTILENMEFLKLYAEEIKGGHS